MHKCGVSEKHFQRGDIIDQKISNVEVVLVILHSFDPLHRVFRQIAVMLGQAFYDYYCHLVFYGEKNLLVALFEHVDFLPDLVPTVACIGHVVLTVYEAAF